ncbi:MAG: helix-turn-helix transcriptional regulator [Deltaproteobacteria bacterium]|nr:helix-turn-helix transcriptional regulator [Deltaproteobacteria bacterium]
MKELMTTRELADFLRLNEKKVYELIRDGNIPHVKIAGKWLFPRDHVLRWIDENVHRERDIRIVGSDDILLGRLLSLYSGDNFPESIMFYSPVGSVKGIEALARKKGHACCIHLLDLETGEYNLPTLARMLAPQKYVVVNLWHRTQGLMVRKGNPHAVKGVEDIVTKNVRFINRNEGSGTRVLLEYLVSQAGMNEKDIDGFYSVADSHLAVALKVFLGDADVGMGIEYVTHLVPLDFIPLRDERFDLVVPKALWPTSTMQRFISYLRPEKIATLSRNLPGYSMAETGKVLFES